MLLIELTVPRGVLDDAAKSALAARLVDALMVEDDSHALEILDAQRRIVQVLVHEPAAWVLGERPAADPADPPRYLVRVTVPNSWRKDMAGHAVRIITDVLAGAERAAGRDPGRLTREPHATVLVDGVPEGGIGLFGRAMGSMDLTEFVSRPYRDSIASRQAPPPQPAEGGPAAGRLVDPVCGMSVTLDDSALTLVHAGVLYGFCHGLCRRAFAEEHGVPLGAPPAP